MVVRAGTCNDQHPTGRPPRGTEWVGVDSADEANAVLTQTLIRQALYHFLLVVCSNNVSVFHCFRDTTVFAVHVTACDLGKSFIFNKAVEISSHLLSCSCVNIILIHAIFPMVWKLERFRTAKVTFNVTQGHWHWCHSISHIQFPISLPLNYVSRSCVISEISCFLKWKEVLWPWTYPNCSNPS